MTRILAGSSLFPFAPPLGMAGRVETEAEYSRLNEFHALSSAWQRFGKAPGRCSDEATKLAAGIPQSGLGFFSADVSVDGIETTWQITHLRESAHHRRCACRTTLNPHGR